MKKHSPSNKKLPGNDLPLSRRTGKDEDDLVHSREREETSTTGEFDPDDRVHRDKKMMDNPEAANMEDPDDAVHKPSLDNEDEE